MNCYLGTKSAAQPVKKNGSSMKPGQLYLVIDNGGDYSYRNGQSVVCKLEVTGQLLHFNGSTFPASVYSNGAGNNLTVEPYNGTVILQN